MLVTITRISRKEKISKKSGKPFISLGIITEEHGDKWLSGFDGKETESWVPGNKVEIEVEKKGDYLNFTVPKKDSSPAMSEGATAELKNILMLKVIPLIEDMQTRVLSNFDRLMVLLKADKEDDFMPGFGENDK